MYLVLFNVLSIKAQADSPIHTVHKSLTLIGREHIQIKDWSICTVDNHVTFGTRTRT